MVKRTFQTLTLAAYAAALVSPATAQQASIQMDAIGTASAALNAVAIEATVSSAGEYNYKHSVVISEDGEVQLRFDPSGGEAFNTFLTAFVVEMDASNDTPEVVTYNWTGPGGYTSTSANPSFPNAATSVTGTYTLTVSTPTCTSAPTTTNLVVNETPPDPVPVANGPICEGSTLTISSGGSASYSYDWSGTGGFNTTHQKLSFPNASDTLTGTYTVTATTNWSRSTRSAPSP